MGFYSDTLILHSTTTTYSVLIFPKKIQIPRKCFYDFPNHKKHREIEYVGQKSVIAVCEKCPYLMRKIKTSIGKIITPLSRVYHICSTTQHTITIQHLSCKSSNRGLHRWLAATSQTECVRSKIRRCLCGLRQWVCVTQRWLNRHSCQRNAVELNNPSSQSFQTADNQRARFIVYHQKSVQRKIYSWGCCSILIRSVTAAVSYLGY